MLKSVPKHILLLVHAAGGHRRICSWLSLLTHSTPPPAPPPPQRDFSRVGAAAQSELLPAWRKEQLAADAADAPEAAPAQLYVKPILELDDAIAAQPGKRIGF